MHTLNFSRSVRMGAAWLLLIPALRLVAGEPPVPNPLSIEELFRPAGKERGPSPELLWIHVFAACRFITATTSGVP
jgi:hypothetical protein